MLLREIERVGTPIVRDILMAYHLQYFLPSDRTTRECICGDKYGHWPYNKTQDGQVLICTAHAWVEKRDWLQNELVLSGLSMPVPILGDDYHPSVERQKLALKHPMTIPPQVIETAVGEPAILANQIVSWLAGPKDIVSGINVRQHIVSYLHRSQVSNLLLNNREQELQHTVLYSPMLVYWCNHDRRNMSEWTEALISLRQFGVAVVVKEALRS